MFVIIVEEYKHRIFNCDHKKILRGQSLTTKTSKIPIPNNMVIFSWERGIEPSYILAGLSV